MLKWIKLVFLFCLIIFAVVVGVVFSLQNSTDISIVFFGVILPTFSMGVWMSIALLLGAIIGLLISLIPLLWSKRSSQNKNKKIQQLEKELTKIRVSGLKG